MSNLRNKILEAVEKGMERTFQFDLKDYDSNSKDSYIQKKKVNLDKNDKLDEATYIVYKVAQKFLNDEHLDCNEKDNFIKACDQGAKYVIDDDKEKLQKIILNNGRQLSWKFNLNWIDTQNITDMSALFADRYAFDGDISEWNTSNVTDMHDMFNYANSFNQPIGDWDVSNVRNMSSMFRCANSFNQPIGDWDVSNVENMRGMFSGAWDFNQPIGQWDVRKVEIASAMFQQARNFNQDIRKWEFNSLSMSFLSNMFEGCPIKKENKPHFINR